MKITLYEPWMEKQVIDLFVDQYESDRDEFTQFFKVFYGSSFQKDKAIRIVALDEDKVIGLQAYFYWPYSKDGVAYNSYQSGNSIVHPDYRGQGLFGKMLNHIDEIASEFKIDFLLGFPVEASKNSFLRREWSNLFDLEWHVKLVSILSLLKPYKIDNYKFLNDNSKASLIAGDSSHYKLTESEAFLEWRSKYSNSESYFTKVFESNGEVLELECKVQVRKKYIKQLVIGRIRTDSQDVQFVTQSLKKFIKLLRKQRLATIISIAYNSENNTVINKAIDRLSFRKISNKIYFIVKPFTDKKNILNRKNWELYHNDIDTW